MRQPVLLLLLITLSTIAAAQVQVSQEPRHHKVLDNGWVRVLDVHIPPHDTSLLHKHSTPSVFLILSNTKTGSQVLIEPGKTSFADGNIWFESFQDTPRIHRVWNADTVEFHVMDIELPHAPASSFFAMDPQYSKMLFDTRSVRAFRMTLPAGIDLAMPGSSSPVLVINLSGPAAEGLVNKQSFTKKGDFLFVPANGALSIANEGRADQQFALLYIK